MTPVCYRLYDSQPHPSLSYNFMYMSFYFFIPVSSPLVLPNCSFREKYFRMGTFDKGGEEEEFPHLLQIYKLDFFSPKKCAFFSSCSLIHFNTFVWGFFFTCFPKHIRNTGFDKHFEHKNNFSWWVFEGHDVLLVWSNYHWKGPFCFSRAQLQQDKLHW